MKALAHAYTRAKPIAARTEHPYTLTVRANGDPSAPVIATLKWIDATNFHVCAPAEGDHLLEPHVIPLKVGDVIEVDLPFFERYIAGLLDPQRGAQE